MIDKQPFEYSKISHKNILEKGGLGKGTVNAVLKAEDELYMFEKQEGG